MTFGEYPDPPCVAPAGDDDRCEGSAWLPARGRKEEEEWMGIAFEPDTDQSVGEGDGGGPCSGRKLPMVWLCVSVG